MADKNNLTTLAKRLRPLLKKSISEMGGLGGCFVCDETNSYGGDGALVNHTTGTHNTAVGYNALLEDIDGSNNTGFGEESLQNNESGDYNVAIGSMAMGWGGTNVLYNTAVGALALYSTESNDATAIGAYALSANTTGYGNVAVGYSAIGSSVASDNNIGIGQNALGILNDGDGNTAIGFEAGYELETGQNNVFIGVNSGNDASQKVDAANSIAIGANTYTTKDNQVVLGDANIVETLLRGSVLIGTTTDGMTAGGSLAIAQDLAHRGTKIGFFNTTPIVKELKANHNNWANISDIVAVLLAYGLVDSA